MSEIENIKIKDKNYQRNNHEKYLTKQNSPISIKRRRYIGNYSSNINNNKKAQKIKIKKTSEEKKKIVKMEISNEKNKNEISKRINFHSRKKDLKNKNLKKYSSPDFDSENRENSFLLQKLKNIQMQTCLIKEELKKYKKIEKFLESSRKIDKNYSKSKNIKKNEITKTDNNNEKQNNNNKYKNITINVTNDNKTNSHRKYCILNSERAKNKNILTDFIKDIIENNPNTTVNYKLGDSQFRKFKNNELKKFFSSNTKREAQNKQNKSVENRKKIKLTKNNNLSYKNTNINNISEIKKSNKNSKILNDKNITNKNEYFSPIKKNKYKKIIINSDFKSNGDKSIIKHKKENSLSISTNDNVKNYIKIEKKEKEKSNRSNRKIKQRLHRSVENLEKKYNIKFHESKAKSQSEISDDLLLTNTNREKEIFKEKEILKIEKLCKKGYEGNGRDKINQDNFFIYRNFNNDSNNIYMGVCDGHGQFGHEISSFLVTNLPLVLGNFLRIFNINNISSTDNATLLPIVTSSFKQINRNLSLENNIDCTLSGSTCVSLIFTPQKVFCINIGDSRCIIGKYERQIWKSVNLSVDHKPELEKEKKRIIDNGGVLRQMKDNDGEFIGPQRVWVKETDLPGLAMSRSFGDEIAHQIGVICEPEIIEYQLHEEDKFLVLASDGIWEFISSQECVDIVKDYYINENCKGAVKHLYKEACKRWLDEEDSIDDITIIIVFFK